jgi:hypothetical protein
MLTGALRRYLENFKRFVEGGGFNMTSPAPHQAA